MTTELDKITCSDTERHGGKYLGNNICDLNIKPNIRPNPFPVYIPTATCQHLTFANVCLSVSFHWNFLTSL